MNEKQAKSLRRAVRAETKSQALKAEYISCISKYSEHEVTDNEGKSHRYRDERLTILLDKRSPRWVYQRAKQVAARGSARTNVWGSTGQLWSSSPGFLPDRRIVDLTPRDEVAPADNAGGSSPVHGVSEIKPGNEQAQAG